MELKSKGHIALFIAYLIFGLNIPIAKNVLASGMVSPYSLTLMRICGGALLFWAASLAMPREPVTLRDIVLLFFASMLGLVVNQTAFIEGLAHTSSINASIISTLGPVITMILAAIFLREPITWLKGLGVAVGASGALLLILESGQAISLAGHMRGDLLCLLSSLAFACYLTIFKPLIVRYTPLTLMKWMFLFAALVATPFGYKDLVAIRWQMLPLEIILEMSFVVIFASFITYLLLPVGQRLLRPTVVSSYNYMQPVVATAVALIGGTELFGWQKAGAGALVFLGVWIIAKSKSRAQLDAQRGGSWK